MKIVKPMAVSFHFRPFLVRQRRHLCVSSLIGFALGDGVRRLVSEIKLWPVIGEVIAGVVDEGHPKARGEVVVYGSCYAPGGIAVPVTTARVCVKPAVAPPGTSRAWQVDKTLTVFGHRYWVGSSVRAPSTESAPWSYEKSEPVPFTEMPIDWAHAFGGESFAKNPLGKGMVRVTAEGGLERLPLPNTEHPSKLVMSSSERPDPAGFAPLDVSWPQRQSKAGSYGGKWLEEEFPGFAGDTDPAFFSTAPEDQRIEGFFRGDEEYVLENMHAAQPVLRGCLPGVAARVLVRRKGHEGVEDVKMHLDTVVFLPGKEIGILVFRGLTPIVEDDASDIAIGFAACEDMNAPRPTEDYVLSLDKRLDKDMSPLASLNENDMLPPFAAGAGLAELLGNLEDPSKARRDGIRERMLARMRQRLVDAKIENPDAVLAKATEQPPFMKRLERLPDPADPNDLAAYAEALDELAKYGEEKREKALESAKKQLDDLEASIREGNGGWPTTPQAEQARREGLEKIAAARRAFAGEPPPPDAPPTGEGPPKPKAPELLARLTDAMIEPDPKHLMALQKADAAALETYRRSAHYKPAARHLDVEERERGRRDVMELRAAGTSFAEIDWTRYDLSALDLSQADLKRTLLEGANLANTCFTGADLSGAVLAHAAVTGTNFDGATLEGTNLGATTVEGASFVGAKLENAVFGRARLVSASFKEADLTGAKWVEAELGIVDFEGATADGITFLPKMTPPKKGARREPPPTTDLTQCRFARTRLKKASFLHANLQGVDFSEADLELATLLTARASAAKFRGASLRKLHAVMECSFAGANFDGADLSGAFMRGSNLRGASFEEARLDGADLSECDLTGANLSRVQAKGVRFIGANLTQATLASANLMEAMLQKSKLYGADLRGANLFGANLGQILVDTETRVLGANLKRALLFPKAKTP
jgi:uncharacterized protein YjbI with pentapeptide repeats